MVEELDPLVSVFHPEEISTTTKSDLVALPRAETSFLHIVGRYF